MGSKEEFMNISTLEEYKQRESEFKKLKVDMEVMQHLVELKGIQPYDGDLFYTEPPNNREKD